MEKMLEQRFLAHPDGKKKNELRNVQTEHFGMNFLVDDIPQTNPTAHNGGSPSIAAQQDGRNPDKYYMGPRRKTCPADANPQIHDTKLSEISRASPFDVINFEGNGFQKMEEALATLSAETPRNETSDQQLVEPRWIYDNMVVGHFTPYSFIAEDPSSNVTRVGQVERTSENISTVSPTSNYSPASLSSIYAEMFPSPSNSNSSSQPQRMSAYPTPGTSEPRSADSENLLATKSESNTQAKTESSQICLGVTPSGCTTMDTKSVNKFQNDGFGTYLVSEETYAPLYTERLRDLNSPLNRFNNRVPMSGKPGSQQARYDTRFSGQELLQEQLLSQNLQVANQNQTPRPNNVTSDVSLEAKEVADNCRQEVKLQASLGRFFVLPQITNNYMYDYDSVSLASVNSNNGGSTWCSPFTSDLTEGPFANSSRQSGRSSLSGKGSRNKRAHSNSPLSAEGIDLHSIIRMSPTSLMSYLVGSRSSSSCMSPGSVGDRTGCYGHLSARNSSSPPSGTGSSLTRFSATQTPKSVPSDIPETANTDVSFLDFDSTLLVLQTMQELESGFVVDPLNFTGPYAQNQMIVPGNCNFPVLSSRTDNMSIAPAINSSQSNMAYRNPQQDASAGLSKNALKALPPLPKKLPPSYDQHMARKAVLQKKSSSDSSQPSNSNSSSFESSEGDKTGTTAGGSSSTDSDIFECQWLDCHAVFQDQEDFVTHLEKQHVDQRKGEEFYCLWKTCPRKSPFNARYKLLMHMRVHSGEKPNKCTYRGCTKAFSRLENLKIHTRSHTGERPYSCLHESCNKTFSNSSDRAKHQKTHQDTRPYVCQAAGCGKRYTDPSSLRKHAKSSHSEKKDHSRKKIRGGVEELSPKDVSECLVIQSLSVSPLERTTDSGLGRSPRTSLLGASLSTEYCPGFSTSGETNSRCSSSSVALGRLRSPTRGHQTSPRLLRDIGETEASTLKQTNLGTPKLPQLHTAGANVPVRSAVGCRQQQLSNNSQWSKSQTLSSCTREKGNSTTAESSKAKFPQPIISLSSMSRGLVGDQFNSALGYFNTSNGNTKGHVAGSNNLLLNGVPAGFDGVS